MKIRQSVFVGNKKIIFNWTLKGAAILIQFGFVFFFNSCGIDLFGEDDYELNNLKKEYGYNGNKSFLDKTYNSLTGIDFVKIKGKQYELVSATLDTFSFWDTYIIGFPSGYSDTPLPVKLHARVHHYKFLKEVDSTILFEFIYQSEFGYAPYNGKYAREPFEFWEFELGTKYVGEDLHLQEDTGVTFFDADTCQYFALNTNINPLPLP